MRVDSHQHFWVYKPADYPWIGAGMDRLRRDFLPLHFGPELEAAGFQRAVSVQASQTLRETEWLLELSSKHEFVAGVVGWVPLAWPRVGDELDRLAANPRLKGIRHILHDEADDNYMLAKDFNRGVALLEEYRLVYDILIFERHLGAAVRFVDGHPNQVFVLDHLGKPRIREGEFSEWASGLRDLASRRNVYCKLSGLVTEASWEDWTEADLWPCFETALEVFGPDRLLFGSDWPVCLLAGEYGDWFETAKRMVGKLSLAEQERIFGLTAAAVYRLDSPE